MLGNLLVLILSVIPFFLWAASHDLTQSFSTYPASSYSLGLIFGLTGMATFCLNFILSSRLRFLEKAFNGLNRMYVTHGVLGLTSFTFLVMHPVMLMVANPTYIVAFIKGSFTTPIIVSGMIGLAVLTILILATLSKKLKFHIWKLSHQFMGAVLFFGGIHGLTLAKELPVKYYLFSLTILAAVSFVYKVIFKGFWFKKFKYQVAGVKDLNENVIEVSLKPLTQGMRYRSGQFLFLRFFDKDRQVTKEEHPFSIASAENDEILKVGIKKLGDYTTTLRAGLEVEIPAVVEGPYGVFNYQNSKYKDQIWVAGGIGITPFMGMLRTLYSKQVTDYMVDFWISFKNEGDSVYLNEILQICDAMPNVKLHIKYSDLNGYLCVADFGSAPELAGKDIFICGPPAFMKGFKEQLRQVGVSRLNIHTEEFALR